MEPTGEESEVAFQAATTMGRRCSSPNGAADPAVDAAPGSAKPIYTSAKSSKTNGKLACNLKDLTPLQPGGSADVLNVIPGISEDGSSVYFVANGVLAPGAVQGHCVHESQETRAGRRSVQPLRLARRGDQLRRGALERRLRATGAACTAPDVSATRGEPPGSRGCDLARVPERANTSRSCRRCRSPAMKPRRRSRTEGVRDQEVYLYDAATRLAGVRVVQPERAVRRACTTRRTPAKGLGLLVDRRGDWSGQYLAGSVPGWTPLGIDGAIHQPRYLSNSGRLFFDSPDQLVPQATNGKEDVYEYEPDRSRQLRQPAGCVSLISSGSAAAGIGVPGSQRKRRRRVLHHRPAARRRRPRHQLRPL